MKDERGGEMEQQGILKNKAYLYLTDTICSVFENVYTVDVEGSTNRELFASDAQDLLGTLLANAEELEDGGLRSMMDTVGGKLTACEGRDMILTDDKAPVEVLGRV